MAIKEYTPSKITAGRRIVLDPELLEDLGIEEGQIIIPYKAEDGSICLATLGMLFQQPKQKSGTSSKAKC